VELGAKNRKKTMWAIVLGVLAVAVVAYQFSPSSSSNFSAPGAATPSSASGLPARPMPHRASGPGTSKKSHAANNLDPTLRLDLLATSEQTKYAGSGRNIFVSQAQDIPQPKGSGVTDTKRAVYAPPSAQAPAPINLKFFGFANEPGEPKKIFLSQGDDVFIAAEGDIVNRRYKVMRISPNSVEIQDVLGSGPPQNIPLTQA
jgi:hypothetical protein